MRKIQTIAEMTEGMNEFEKFRFFSRKEEERVELMRIFWSLHNDGGMDLDEMRKDLRISGVVWDRYLFGEMPLPDDLLFKIKNRYKGKIAEYRRIKSERRMREFSDFMLSPLLKSEDSPKTDKDTSTEALTEPAKQIPISAPEKVTL